MKMSANAALVTHIFSPFRIQCEPSGLRVAVVFAASASDPLPASENAYADSFLRAAEQRQVLLPQLFRSEIEDRKSADSTLASAGDRKRKHARHLFGDDHGGYAVHASSTIMLRKFDAQQSQFSGTFEKAHRDIKLLPFDAGLHPAMTSSWTKRLARSRIINCSSEKSSGVKTGIEPFPRLLRNPPPLKSGPPPVREWFGILAFIGRGDVTVSDKLVLVDHQSIDADRSAGMGSIRTDSHFRAQSITESVGKMRGRIPVDAGRVHLVQESLRAGRVFGHDGIRVRRAVTANVFDGFVQVFNRTNRQDEVQKFVAKLRFHAEVHSGRFQGSQAVRSSSGKRR